jgi:guanylate kinase
LFVVSGPSGAGKSTLVAGVIAKVPDLKYAISFTTRQRRENEVDGRDYFFVESREFEKMRARGDLIEWAEVYGSLYGRSRRTLKTDLDAGRDVVLSIDVQGAASLKRALPESVSVFILPPSFEVLSDRLRARQTDFASAVEHRLEIARQEVLRFDEYDYIVINGGLEQSVASLEAIVIAERHRQDRMREHVKQVIETFR